MTVLELVGIGRTYPGPPDVVAITDAELRIEQGEFVAIVGPSGGGKSTLLNILGLLDRPSAGRYEIDGVDTAGLDDADLSRMRSDTFGFVFQSFHLLDRRPVVDSVGLNLLYRGVTPETRKRRALTALTDLGIADYAQTTADRLSGGQRQRVAIARALAASCPVIIADEPTGNLDTENGAKVVEALRRAHERGVTVILVTHDSEVAAAADRRIRIRDGRLSADTDSPVLRAVPTASRIGTASRVRPADLLQDAMASARSRVARSLAGVVAVGVAVALAVGAFAIVATSRAQVSDRFDAHANREVSARWTPHQGLFQPDDAEMLDQLGALSGVRDVVVIDELGGRPVQTVAGRPALVAPIYAATGELVMAARVTLGQTIDGDGVLIGANLAAQLDLPRLASHPVLLVDGEPAAVNGVIEKSPRMPELLGALVWIDGTRPGEPSQRLALLECGPGAARQVAGQVATVVDPAEPTSIEVLAPADPSTLRAEIEGDVALVLGIFTALALLASIVALANAMAAAVSERRSEIGLRRAVGARTRHITALVLTESSLIGLVGGGAGLVLGLLAALALTASQGWIPVFEPLVAPIALGGGVAIGALAGVLAARRAAKVQPSAALRGA